MSKRQIATLLSTGIRWLETSGYLEAGQDTASSMGPPWANSCRSSSSKMGNLRIAGGSSGSRKPAEKRQFDSVRMVPHPHLALFARLGWGFSKHELLNLDHAFRRVRPNLVDPRNHFAREIIQSLGVWCVLAFEHGRFAGIPRPAEFWIQLNGAQKRHAKLLGSPFRAAPREDIDFVIAMRAHEVAHVLDHADQVDLHLAEHLNRLAPILQRNVGRRRDHDCAGQRNGLYQR